MVFWRRPVYYVSLDKWKRYGDGGGANFKVFKDKRAAVQCFLRNPKYGQIDVRGYKIKPYCWMYWNRGRIVVQKELRR